MSDFFSPCKGSARKLGLLVLVLLLAAVAAAAPVVAQADDARQPAGSSAPAVLGSRGTASDGSAGATGGSTSAADGAKNGAAGYTGNTRAAGAAGNTGAGGDADNTGAASSADNTNGDAGDAGNTGAGGDAGNTGAASSADNTNGYADNASSAAGGADNANGTAGSNPDGLEVSDTLNKKLSASSDAMKKLTAAGDSETEMGSIGGSGTPTGEQPWGSYYWSVDADGVLLIRPAVGTTDRMPNSKVFPWLESYTLCNSIKKVVIARGSKLPLNASRMFESCSLLAEVTAEDWATATAGTQTMSGMFYYCTSLKKIDTSRWNTSSVTKMDELFYGCASLAAVNVSGWDTRNVTTMEAMFHYCKSLTSIDVRNWNTAKLVKAGMMFSGCEKLSSLDASKWNTANLRDAYCMFSYCTSLATLNVRNWDTSKVTDLVIMFDECESLTKFIVGNKFNVSKAFPHSRYVVKDQRKIKKNGRTVDATFSYSFWYSQEKAKQTFAYDDIKTKRNGIADTYTAQNKKPFVISTVTGITNQTFMGPACKQSPTVKYKGTTLKAGTDYTISYANNTKPGTAKVTLTGKGSYFGSITKTFSIWNWSAATRMPVDSTQIVAVGKGYWVKIRRDDGSFTLDDGTMSVRGLSNQRAQVTAKKPGVSTICLLDSKNKVIASKTITVYTITNHDYEMQSILANNLVLDIRYKSRANGAEMIVWTRKTSGYVDNQRYQFVRLGDGSYAIRCKHSGKYVDVKYGGTKYGQPVIQWYWKGGANQRWLISVNHDNSVTFTCKKSGMCFDVKGGKVKSGAAMIQWPFKNGSNQKWKLNQK